MPEPEIFLWFDDLVEALLVREQLSSFRDFNWQLPPESLERREEAQRRVRERLGLRTWDEVVEAVGPEHRRNRHETRQLRGVNFGVAVRRTDTLQAGLPIAVDDHPCDHEVIEQAAARVGRAGIDAYYELAHIVQRSAGPGILGHYGISHDTSFYDDYRYEQLFRHDCLLNICGDQASAAYDGLRRTVQHAGPWWAFRNAAILCDRPRDVWRDSEGRLHRHNGPAVIFWNGVELFAWHGVWIPAEAIRSPWSLSASTIRAEGDPKVRRGLIEIYGAERYERERRPMPLRKPGDPLAIHFFSSAEEKIERLRGYGPLPHYERYLAGEHHEVWRELGALGAEIRSDRYVADALAVGCATMRRVVQNIRTIVERLRELGYEFDIESVNRDTVIHFGVARWSLWVGPRHQERPAPWMPPQQRLADLKRLERDAGELPISLRAWYEIGGSVTLLGKHPVLSPGDGTLLPDPLVIAPLSQVVRAWDDSPPDVGIEGRSFVADLAPDATSKAHGGGQSYSMMLPAVGMDALLQNERHGLSFVDYLRLAIEWGGFPGFEMAGQRPKEIDFLSQGLLAF